ncbi:OmpA family protein [Nocardiopsis sp. RSe5-2]|uniref:OmpA family protein n=1 Tax=Nocardiopsis endophytica TaxID=3018445 RepID=A0ABT4U564_9ACTN|nr:OmpA family protein [Nocardiopsis endophytica]MDA2812085.1 OmpA family protein [Nocardiopsis endophytica]
MSAMSERRPPAGRLVTAAAAALLLPAAAACFPDPVPAADGVRCDAVLSSTGASDAPVTAEVVVLIDVSASMWTDQGYPDLAERIAAEAVDADVFGRPDQRLLSVGLFGGPGAPAFPLDRVPLPEAVGLADGRQATDLRAVTECLKEELRERVPGDGALRAGSDILRALTAGAGRMEGNAGEAGNAEDGEGADRRLLVYTDGLANTGCLDMDRYFGDGLGSEEVTADCAASGEDRGLELSGVDVRLHLQDTGAEARDPSQDAAVRSYWEQVCAAFGGTDCLEEAQAPGGYVDAAAPEAEDPEVALPRAEFPDRGTVSLPSQLLFAFDSAELLDEAETLLDEAAAHLRDGADEAPRVTVTGHTDSKGSGGYNEDLSLRRAEAVAEYLESAGFAEVSVSGAGERDPVCEGDYRDGELLDAACAQENRRVDIEIAD